MRMVQREGGVSGQTLQRQHATHHFQVEGHAAHSCALPRLPPTPSAKETQKLYSHACDGSGKGTGMGGEGAQGSHGGGRNRRNGGGDRGQAQLEPGSTTTRNVPISPWMGSLGGGLRPPGCTGASSAQTRALRRLCCTALPGPTTCAPRGCASHHAPAPPSRPGSAADDGAPPAPQPPSMQHA